MEDKKRIIEEAIQEAIKQLKKQKDMDVEEEMAFNYVMLDYFYLHEPGVDLNYSEAITMVTDGTSDGGVDFVYYDDDESRVIIGQCKHTESLSKKDILSELSTMNNTVEGFKKGNTASYNSKVKATLQDAIDRLPDDSSNNIEYSIFTTSSVNKDDVLKTIDENEAYKFSADSVNIFDVEDIGTVIDSINNELLVVDYEKISIDKAKNYLSFENDKNKGIMVNLSSKSLIAMYNKYKDKGLFDLNIRRYITNKIVDTKIKNTLDHDIHNFWFLNNGVTIACEDFDIDGDKVSIERFSIVNGGQTTTLIGDYDGGKKEEYFIPCKIVCEKKQKTESDFFNKIAEATNSQKPINPRDLKSNSKEMRNLKRWLSNEGVCLEIKRGVKTKGTFNYTIKNDVLAQLILSFRDQMPGTARSNKKKIFDSPDVYKQIFKVNYEKNSDYKQFILDLVDLNARIDSITDKIQEDLPLEKQVILKNGKYMIVAILGLLYRTKKCALDITKLDEKGIELGNNKFEYSPITHNYTADDLDELIKNLMNAIINCLDEAYKRAVANGKATSVSNLFKTEAKYYEDIIPVFVTNYGYSGFAAEIDKCSQIFK